MRKLPGILDRLDEKRIDEPQEVAEELIELNARFDQRELGLAYGVFASCMRSLDRVKTAEAAIGRGLEILEDPWDVANLLKRRALIEAHSGDFDSAFRSLERSALGCAAAGDVDGVGATLSVKAMFHFNSGDYQACQANYEAALKFLDYQNHHRRFACFQGIAIVCIETGEFENLSDNLRAAKLLLDHLTENARVKFFWTEGRVAAKAGRYDLAEQAFREASCFFRGKGMALDAAIATLELSQALFRQGRPADATAEAYECRRHLLHFGERSPAAAVITVIWKKAEERKLSSRIVGWAIEQLERGRASARTSRNA